MNPQSNDTFIIKRAKKEKVNTPKILKRQDRKPTIHSWTYYQNLTYIKFLKENYDKFQSHQNRKKQKPFLQLSRLLGSRKSTQVKSHHQKLMDKYNSVSNIILNLEQYLSRQIFVKQEENDFSTISNIVDTIDVKIDAQSPQNVCQQDSPHVYQQEQDSPHVYQQEMSKFFEFSSEPRIICQFKEGQEESLI